MTALIAKQVLKLPVCNRRANLLALSAIFKESLGLILYLHCNSLKRDCILFGVMATEEQFTCCQRDANIGLGATTIASI